MSIFSQLLFPTEKISRLPLKEWAESLHVRLTRFHNDDDIQKNLDEFAIILNQIPLVMSFVNDMDAAIKMCHDTIAFYFHLYQKTKKLELLLQCIQAWINLGRIDRIQNNHEAAIQKFIFLQSRNANETFTEPPLNTLAKIVAQALTSLNEDHQQIKTIVDFCMVAEPAITLLKQEDYSTLLVCYPLLNKLPDFMSERFICEAQIIALMKLGKYKQAQRYLQTLGHKKLKSHYHLFLFRTAELAFLTNEQLTLINCLGKLQQVLQKMDIKYGNHNAINFLLAYAALLFSIGKPEQAMNLTQLSYDRYQVLNDEVGQIQTLNLFIKYGKKDDAEIQARLQQLYLQTGYRFLVPTEIKNEFNGYDAIETVKMSLERQLTHRS